MSGEGLLQRSPHQPDPLRGGLKAQPARGHAQKTLPRDTWPIPTQEAPEGQPSLSKLLFISPDLLFGFIPKSFLTFGAV